LTLAFDRVRWYEWSAPILSSPWIRKPFFGPTSWAPALVAASCSASGLSVTRQIWVSSSPGRKGREGRQVHAALADVLQKSASLAGPVTHCRIVAINDPYLVPHGTISLLLIKHVVRIAFGGFIFQDDGTIEHLFSSI